MATKKPATSADPVAERAAREIAELAAKLHVTPEELRSAVQKGGEMVEEVHKLVARDPATPKKDGSS